MVFLLGSCDNGRINYLYLVRVGGVKPLAVHVARDDEGKQLLAGPQRLRLDDCRHGKLTVPSRQEHDQCHHVLLREEDVSLCHFSDGGQRVLHDTHDGFVRLRGDDLEREESCRVRCSRSKYAPLFILGGNVDRFSIIIKLTRNVDLIIQHLPLLTRGVNSYCSQSQNGD